MILSLKFENTKYFKPAQNECVVWKWDKSQVLNDRKMTFSCFLSAFCLNKATKLQSMNVLAPACVFVSPISSASFGLFGPFHLNYFHWSI